MITSFANKNLQELWETNKSKKLDARLHKRILARLNALDGATEAEDMNVPGFNYHQLIGHTPTRYTVHVNGPWCITFEFHDGNAYIVDFVQYH